MRSNPLPSAAFEARAKAVVDKDLLAAFLATEYRVMLGEETIVVTTGRYHRRLDMRLQHRPWAILTAWNPGACARPEAENQGRHQLLASAVSAAGLESHPSRNHVPDQSWPDEPGLLLLDPARRWLIRQARAFGQLGVVCGQPGQLAELWLLASCPVRPLPAAVCEVDQ